MKTILSISSIAFKTAFDFLGLGSLINLPREVGMTCHNKPNLSFSYRTVVSLRPCESFYQSSLTSFCVS